MGGRDYINSGSAAAASTAAVWMTGSKEGLGMYSSKKAVKPNTIRKKWKSKYSNNSNTGPSDGWAAGKKEREPAAIDDGLRYGVLHSACTREEIKSTERGRATAERNHIPSNHSTPQITDHTHTRSCSSLNRRETGTETGTDCAEWCMWAGHQEW
ncbi:predicted protein [Histoplasma capsulatum var. duboisii H88]|uniref:Predicted protein n=1 Tax=Ajellomyces capsulatus (strain H88) TaxID=544711 RepID=F0U6D2_AJEC8|nr:predicted protein [Histoplasma capsulatum var. duboisii H88]